MSQAVITKSFSEWKAQQAVNNKAVVLDEFVFAYIPDLDVNKPISNTETIPAADKIVHRQAVSKCGVVNDNSVVYSVTLGADVGDFDFNWIGLTNKATDTLAMIIHAPTQSKVKNASGQQGNVLVRSMLMEYSGAQAATEITTPAETWQIDFTARLAAMDERQRLENVDQYGPAAFFGEGYLVAKSGTKFLVTKGAGYVAGLRAELPADLNITTPAGPTKVWLDVCWEGTLTSEWAVQTKITVAEDLVDYHLGGVRHYVYAVASIDTAGKITDLRPKGSLNDQTASYALKEHEQSRNHPDATTSAKGFTQLSNATDDASEEQAATPRAVKIAMDNANARLAKERNGGDIPNPTLFVQNIGLRETVDKAAGAVQRTGDTMSGKLNLPQTSSFGVNTDNALGGNSIVLGDSDTGFKQESDGVIGIYANNQKVAEITNTEFKIIGNASLINGALLLGGLTHFIRHTDNDNAGFGANNVEIGSWNGIGLTCTYDGTTRIYFNPRTGEVGLRGDLKADGNVYSGDAWLDQTGNLQGRSWGGGVGLKAYLDNTFNKKNTAVLSGDGWSRDESTGLITQWGNLSASNFLANFPRAFPNECFAVFVTNTSFQGDGVDNAFGYPVSNTQFFAATKSEKGLQLGYPVAWYALGR